MTASGFIHIVKMKSIQETKEIWFHLNNKDMILKKKKKLLKIQI